MITGSRVRPPVQKVKPRDIREHLGLRTADVAAATGYTVRFVQRFEADPASVGARARMDLGDWYLRLWVGARRVARAELAPLLPAVDH